MSWVELRRLLNGIHNNPDQSVQGGIDRSAGNRLDYILRPVRRASGGSPFLFRRIALGDAGELPPPFATIRAKNVRTPSLLQVGSLDINHNAEIYQALLDHKVPVEYVVYPREGHGLTEPAHIRDLLERNLNWFLRWLKPSATH